MYAGDKYVESEQSEYQKAAGVKVKDKTPDQKSGSLNGAGKSNWMKC